MLNYYGLRNGLTWMSVTSAVGGAVDQKIDAVKIPLKARRQVVDVFIARQIRWNAANISGRSASRIRNCLQLLQNASHQTECGTLRRESQSNRFADATAGTCYKRYLIRQTSRQSCDSNNPPHIDAVR